MVFNRYNDNKSICNLIIITGNLVRTTSSGNPLFEQKHNERVLGQRIKKGMALQHPAMFVTRSTYDAVGLFDKNYKFIADWDFLWRAFSKENVLFLFTDTITSYMREGGASDTLKFKNIWIRTLERFYLRKKYMSWIVSFYLSGIFFIVETFRQVLKRILPLRIKAKYYTLKHKNLSEKS